MASFTVHAPPTARSEDAMLSPADAERVTFVKDGIAWPALFFPLLWILWHRLWLTLVLYAAGVFAVGAVERLAGDAAATIFGLLATLLFALEANNIRRWSLARRGWREVGAVLGRNLGEAEVRFFGGAARATTEARPASAPPALSPLPVERRAYVEEGPVLGMFPEPGA